MNQKITIKDIEEILNKRPTTNFNVLCVNQKGYELFNKAIKNLWNNDFNRRTKN